MKLAMVMIAALALPSWVPSVTLPSWWRETSSHASSARGARAFSDKKYPDAAKAFGRAEQLAPSTRNAFNLGTAEIAAGNREQGSAHLAEAIKDPALRADAFFNRGNSALESKALDRAIHDYADALRANPNHPGAKRNLEIALSRQQQQKKQQQSSGGKGQQGKNQQKPQPSETGQKPAAGQPDLEALLRGVQQQEQEELRRMKGQAAEGKVGW
jgi:Ca-activated chloride channel family protein